MWGDDVLGRVRLLILGGEACSAALGWRLARGREVWNTYGPTEATVVSTAARVHPGERVTIGGPLPGWEVAVVDERGSPSPKVSPGELVIAGVGLGRYIDPALDARGFAGAPPARLGACLSDRGHRPPSDAGLEFIGRRDDQVKIGGRRIELAEIDAHLCARRAPGPPPPPSARRRRKTRSSSVTFRATSTRRRLGRSSPTRLPEGIVPVIVRLDMLPLKGSGKVDRNALPWPPPGTGADAGGKAAPYTRAGPS